MNALWEYKVVTILATDDFSLTNKLNEFGKLGWELLGISSSNNTSVRFVLKKPTSK